MAAHYARKPRFEGPGLQCGSREIDLFLTGQREDGAGVPMISCMFAPSLNLKNPFIRSIASEHKLSAPAIAAAINRRSIKGSKLTVLRAIEG
jgi:hypothetical protein